MRTPREIKHVTHAIRSTMAFVATDIAGILAGILAETFAGILAETFAEIFVAMKEVERVDAHGKDVSEEQILSSW